MALVVKNLIANSGDIKNVARSLNQENSLEKGRAIHSSILAWRTPWTEEPGGLVCGPSSPIKLHDWLLLLLQVSM